eukprot:3452249-Rhodomonas_salina.1
MGPKHEEEPELRLLASKGTFLGEPPRGSMPLKWPGGRREVPHAHSLTSAGIGGPGVMEIRSTAM